jgi:APA family basic amino acid/polyamine antiporter
MSAGEPVPPTVEPLGLGRVLGEIRGLALSLGVVVGAGIFVLPSYLGQLLADPRHFLAIWIVGGLIALCTAVCYAELATVFPRTGGYVVYLHETYGDRLAFVYGWAAMLVLYPASIAGLARVFGRTLTDLLAVQAVELPVAIAVIVAATCVNVAGVGLSARLQVLFTSVKVGALLLLSAFGALHGGSGALSSLAQGGEPDLPGLTAWFLALVAVSWCFDGFLEIVTVAGEVRRPARTLVRVLVTSVLLITIVYAAYAVALTRQLSMAEIAGSTGVAADLANRLLGDAGRAWIRLVVLWSSGSVIVSLLLSGPRIVVGLAETGLFFDAPGRVWRRTRTPALAVSIVGAIAVLYATVGSFVEIVKFFQFAAGLFSALIVAGGVWLRRRGRIEASHRRIPAWPLPPVVSILASLGAVVFVVRDQPRSSVLGLALMLLAWPLSIGFTRRRPDA